VNWQVVLKQKSHKRGVWCTLLLCYWCTLSLVSAGNKVAGLPVGKIDAAHHIPCQNVLQNWLVWTENRTNEELWVESVQSIILLFSIQSS